jgi:hypothetical protein
MNNSSYQKKLDKNTRAYNWFVLALISLLIGGWGIFAHCHAKPQPTVEEQLNDTLFNGHTEILADPGEDSIVIHEKISLYMYHGSHIVATRPNRTWPWLVFDSAGYKIAIAKAKRRDSL